MRKGIVTEDKKYMAQTVIPSYFVDANQKLKPSCFMDMAQEMAYYAADTMHFGYHDLLKANIVWVLARMHIRFLRNPRWDELVNFTTWHRAPVGLFFMRDFLMSSIEGDTLIAATTCWTVIDIKSRKIFRGEAINEIVSPDCACNDCVDEVMAQKVIVPKEIEMESVCAHTVAYSDVDLVGHTNNTRYLLWSMDCLGYEYVLSHNLKEVTINFNHETKAGEIVDILHGSQADKHFVIGQVDGTQVFTIEMIFE